MLLERRRNKEGEIRVSSKVKVLIADDEVLVRIGVIHAIDWEKNGFEIVGEATDGESCLRLAERLQPDLIVLDINMPGMNGIQVLQKLKEQHFLGKVIMLTCYDEFEYVREAMRGGASDYVLKAGMNETGLLDAVKRLEYDKKREKVQSRIRNRRQSRCFGGEWRDIPSEGRSSLIFTETVFAVWRLKLKICRKWRNAMSKEAWICFFVLYFQFSNRQCVAGI